MGIRKDLKDACDAFGGDIETKEDRIVCKVEGAKMFIREDRKGNTYGKVRATDPGVKPLGVVKEPTKAEYRADVIGYGADILKISDDENNNVNLVREL